MTCLRLVSHKHSYDVCTKCFNFFEKYSGKIFQILPFYPRKFFVRLLYCAVILEIINQNVALKKLNSKTCKRHFLIRFFSWPSTLIYPFITLRLLKIEIHSARINESHSSRPRTERFPTFWNSNCQFLRLLSTNILVHRMLAVTLITKVT